jgi:hypothetical protein
VITEAAISVRSVSALSSIPKPNNTRKIPPNMRNTGIAGGSSFVKEQVRGCEYSIQDG